MKKSILLFIVILFMCSCKISENNKKDNYGFYLEYKNKKFELNKDINTLIDNFEDIEIEELPSCANIGITKYFNFKDFSIETYQNLEQKGDFIKNITISNKFENNLNIKLGDSKNDLINKYGNPEQIINSLKNSIYIYKKNNTFMRVTLEKDIITYIFLHNDEE